MSLYELYSHDIHLCVQVSEYSSSCEFSDLIWSETVKRHSSSNKEKPRIPKPNTEVKRAGSERSSVHSSTADGQKKKKEMLPKTIILYFPNGSCHSPVGGCGIISQAQTVGCWGLSVVTCIWAITPKSLIDSRFFKGDPGELQVHRSLDLRRAVWSRRAVFYLIRHLKWTFWFRCVRCVCVCTSWLAIPIVNQNVRILSLLDFFSHYASSGRLLGSEVCSFGFLFDGWLHLFGS